MKVLAVETDAERFAIDYLIASFANRGEDVTVGVTVPTAWVKGTKSHVQVALDGTPDVQYPIVATATIRVTVWNESTTVAKALAALCEGLLLSHPDIPTTSGTGVLPTKDPDTGAQLASITVALRLRYTIPA